MPPNLSGADLQEVHGVMLSQLPFSACPSAFLLHKALTGMAPPVPVTMGAVKTWWTQYRTAAATAAASKVGSAEDFEKRYGDRARGLVAEHPSAHKLCKALFGAKLRSSVCDRRYCEAMAAEVQRAGRSH